MPLPCSQEHGTHWTPAGALWAGGPTACLHLRPCAQVWTYQGANTLSHYLKRRDCMRALSEDLGVREDLVVPTVMQHLFQCLEVRLCVQDGGKACFFSA
jgi:hypothetical protein